MFKSSIVNPNNFSTKTYRFSCSMSRISESKNSSFEDSGGGDTASYCFRFCELIALITINITNAIIKN